MICSKKAKALQTASLKGWQMHARLGAALDSNWSYFLFDSLDGIKDVWQGLVPENQLFLQPSFLSSLEESGPESVTPAYLVFCHFQEPVGVAYLQRFYLSAARALKADSLSWWQRSLAGLLKQEVLICGNLLLTGFPTYAFLPGVQPQDFIPYLHEALQQCMHRWQIKNRRAIDLVLLKDVNPSDDPYFQALKHVHSFTIQPNMYLPIQPEWHSYKNYLGAMTSKYRVRARRAAKKVQGVELKVLSTAEIEDYQPQLYRLYRNVADEVEFNLVHLPKDYFTQLNRHLEDRFTILAYCKQEEMVGFCTLIDDHGIWEAHYLGFDPEVNHDHQLYLNMLYGMVNWVIQKGGERLNFSRTALEIKSSVGAQPEQYTHFTWHRCILQHQLMPWVFRLMNREDAWKQRHPFKNKSS